MLEARPWVMWAWLASLVLAGLLLSAVNTAIVDLIAIQFLDA